MINDLVQIRMAKLFHVQMLWASVFGNKSGTLKIPNNIKKRKINQLIKEKLPQ